MPENPCQLFLRHIWRTTTTNFPYSHCFQWRPQQSRTFKRKLTTALTDSATQGERIGFFYYSFLVPSTLSNVPEIKELAIAAAILLWPSGFG